jgi:hypothetical protein
MTLHTKPIMIDSKKIYDEHKRLFQKFDYFYDRYKIPVSMVLIKFSDPFLEFLNEKTLNLFEKLRLTDEMIDIDKKYKLLFFFSTGKDETLAAMKKIEREIIKEQLLSAYQVGMILKGLVYEKKGKEELEEVLKIMTKNIECSLCTKKCEIDVMDIH